MLIFYTLCCLLLASTTLGSGEVELVLQRLNGEDDRIHRSFDNYNEYTYNGKRISGDDGMFNQNGNKVSVGVGETTYSDIAYDTFYTFNFTELYSTSAQPFTMLWWIEYGDANKYSIKIDHDKSTSASGEMEELEGNVSIARANAPTGGYNFDIEYKAIQLFNRPGNAPSTCLTFFTVISEYFLNIGEPRTKLHMKYTNTNHVEAYVEGKFRYVLFGYALYSKDDSERILDSEVRQAINSTIQILYEEVAEQEEAHSHPTTEEPSEVEVDIPVGKVELFCDTSSTSHITEGAMDMIKSQNYPNKYAENSDCWMSKSVEEGKRIEVMFLTPIAIEGCCDYLEIYDDENKEDAKAGDADLMVHGNQVKNFVSESNFLTLHFHSDSSVEDGGFIIGLRVVSGEKDSSLDYSVVHRIMNELRARNEKMKSLIGDFYSYLIPQSGALIEDGGHDMFDNGNLVSFGEDMELKENEHYGKYTNEEEYEFLTEAGPIFFGLLWNEAPLPRRFALQVVGNAGADGHGVHSEMRGQVNLLEYQLNYYVFQIGGSGDASICEVYFTISSATEWGSNMDYDQDLFKHLEETNRMNSKLSVLGNRFLLGFALLSKWSEDGGNELNKTEITDFLNQVLIAAVSGYDKAKTPPQTTQTTESATRPTTEHQTRKVARESTAMGSGDSTTTGSTTQQSTTPGSTTQQSTTDRSTTQQSTTDRSTTQTMEETTTQAQETTMATPDWHSHQYGADMRDISPLLINVAQALSDNGEEVTGAVGNYYQYVYGDDDQTSIHDGGHDMYDDGNKVTFGRDLMVSEPVYYNKHQTRFYKTESLQFFVQAEHPFYAMMYINDTETEQRHSYSIMVNGNAGADRDGIYSEFSGTFHLGSLNADYNVFQISEAADDPSICEVYFVIYDRENWNSIRYRNLDQFEHMTETNEMRSKITIYGNNIMLAFMLLARREPSNAITRDEVHAAMRPVLQSIASIISGEDYSGQVATYTFQDGRGGSGAYNEIIRDFGLGHLHFRAGDEEEDGDSESKFSLWAISSAIERESELIKEQIKSFYNYMYTAEDESSIADGGLDMFDGGNMISFGEDERYVDRYMYNRKFRGKNYDFTSRAIHPFHALMLINNTHGDDHQYLIRVRGNAGADDFGAATEFRGSVVQEASSSYGRIDLDYYVFQISDAQTDPTICEVYFVVYSEEMWDSVRSPEMDNFDHLNETNSLDSRLSIKGKNLLLGFMLFSRFEEGHRNYAINEEEIQNAMKAVLAAISGALPGATPEVTEQTPEPPSNMVESVMRSLTPEIMDQVTDSIPMFNMYSYDGNAFSISDGGNDMFDSGNKVKFFVAEDEVEEQLVYDKFYKKDNYVFGTKTSHPFIALAWVDPQESGELDLYSVQVTGDPGADTVADHDKYEHKTIYWRDCILDYSVQQLSNAEDPSICQIFFVIYSPSLWSSQIRENIFESREIGQDTINKLSVRGENVMLGYILLSKEYGVKIADYEIQAALQPLFEVIATEISELGFPDLPPPSSVGTANVRSIMTSATLSLQPAGGSLAGIALQIPNWHAYSYDGDTRSSIGDGGNDMYDEGNRVSFSVGGNEYYKDTGAVYNQSFFFEDYAFTSLATHPFIAIMWLGDNELEDVRTAVLNVSGNAGADSDGIKMSAMSSPKEWNGYKFVYGTSQVSGAVSDPSICEVFFLLYSEKKWDSKITETATLTSDGDTNDLHTSFKTTGQNLMLGYLLLSKQRAEEVTTGEVGRVVDNIVKRIATAISHTLANQRAQDATPTPASLNAGQSTTAPTSDEADLSTMAGTTRQPSRSSSGQTTASYETSTSSSFESTTASNDDDDDDDDFDEADFLHLVRRVNTSTSVLMRENIENFHQYSYDGGLEFIQDGGSDMYDTGNAIRIHVDDQDELSVTYNQFYQKEHYMFESVTSHPFAALLFANSSDGEEHEYKITVFGNAGTDGSGKINIFKGNLTEGNCSINYDVFELSGTTDPSICEVYFSTRCDEWDSVQQPSYFSYMSGKDVLRSIFTTEGNRILIGYFLFSKTQGSKVSAVEIERALTIFAQDIQREDNPGEYRAGAADDDDDEEDSATEAVVIKILEAVRDETAEKMRNSIPNFHSYEYDGEDNYSITDGGTDMFDRGNEVKFGKNGAIFPPDTVMYNETYSELGCAWGTIAVHPFVAILWANDTIEDDGDESTNYTIAVSGDAGADGSGMSGLMKGSLSLGVFELEYDVYQVSGAGDASICEVYFVVHSELWDSVLENSPVLNHTAGSGSLAGKYTVTGDNIMMGYTLLSRAEGHAVTEIQVRSALRPLLLLIASSFSDDISVTMKIPENDVALTPTCSVREFTKQLHRNCVENNNLLQPQKYEGPDSCRSVFTEFFSCASELLMDCTWSISQNRPQVVDVLAIQHYMQELVNPTNEFNDMLDVFCYHAPLGISFPFDSDDFLEEECDGDISDDIRAYFAQFYRNFAWSSSTTDIQRWYNEAESNIIRIIRTRCQLEDLSDFYPDMSAEMISTMRGKLRKFLDVFMETLEEI